MSFRSWTTCAAPSSLTSRSAPARRFSPAPTLARRRQRASVGAGEKRLAGADRDVKELGAAQVVQLRKDIVQETDRRLFRQLADHFDLGQPRAQSRCALL